MKEYNSDDRLSNLVCDFYNAQNEFKEIQNEFKVKKDKFEQEIADFMHDRKSVSLDSMLGTLVVKKVEHTNIEWLIDKLKRRVPKKILNRIVKKEYTIRDMKGLSAYLKLCGVDPNIFRQYLDVKESVDQSTIDRLGEIGELTVQNISGCYIVKCSKPYYVLSLKKE